MESRDFEKFQKKSDQANFLRLTTKCYVKRLKKLYLEKTKKKFDNTVISFTKDVVSCECYRRVQII